jgi:hypothetical protein
MFSILETQPDQPAGFTNDHKFMHMLGVHQGGGKEVQNHDVQIGCCFLINC